MAGENDFDFDVNDDTDLWVCSECGKECEALYTIAEWCEEKGLEGEEDYLNELADKQNMASDICEDCFDALVASAGL